MRKKSLNPYLKVLSQHFPGMFDEKLLRTVNAQTKIWTVYFQMHYHWLNLLISRKKSN